MIEGRGLGGKRCVRKTTSLTNKQDADLNKLATACNMTPSHMMYLLIDLCLYDPAIVNALQKEYCTQAAYRIHLINNNGTINYVLRGREDL